MLDYVAKCIGFRNPSLVMLYSGDGPSLGTVKIREVPLTSLATTHHQLPSK